MISALLIRGRRGIGEEDKTRAREEGWSGFGLEGKVSEPWRLRRGLWPWRESEDGDGFESVDAVQVELWNGTRPPPLRLDLPPTAVAV